jgi:hypothetical protein
MQPTQGMMCAALFLPQSQHMQVPSRGKNSRCGAAPPGHPGARLRDARRLSPRAARKKHAPAIRASQFQLYCGHTSDEWGAKQCCAAALVVSTLQNTTSCARHHMAIRFCQSKPQPVVSVHVSSIRGLVCRKAWRPHTRLARKATPPTVLHPGPRAVRPWRVAVLR